jgi:hypothetical protein
MSGHDSGEDASDAIAYAPGSSGMGGGWTSCASLLHHRAKSSAHAASPATKLKAINHTAKRRAVRRAHRSTMHTFAQGARGRP